MFRKKPKDYLELSDVRISYDETDDSVRITGKDKNAPRYLNEVSLKLDGDRSGEFMLRGMLEEAGIITDDHYIPCKVSYDDIADARWDEFPLGKTGGAQSVIWNPTSSPNLLVCGPAGSGKSVIAHSIVFHCLQNPSKWRVVAIDPWDDFSHYKKHAPAGISAVRGLNEAVETCRSVVAEMMKRYEKMEEQGVSNYQDLPDEPHGIIFLVDEISGFLAESGMKSLGLMAEDELKREAALIISRISKLGPAAGINLVLTSQYPDSDVLNGLLKSYMSTKIVIGNVDAVYSSFVLGHSEASHIPSRSRGRGYIQERGKPRGKQFQAAYAVPELYAKWSEKHPAQQSMEPQH